jgi:hypothetical protein
MARSSWRCLGEAAGKIADPISQATMSAPQLAALRSASDGSLLLNGSGQGSRRWIAIGETTGSEPLTTPTSAGADAAVAGGFNPAPGGGIAGTAIRRRQGLRRRQRRDPPGRQRRRNWPATDRRHLIDLKGRRSSRNCKDGHFGARAVRQAALHKVRSTAASPSCR